MNVSMLVDFIVERQNILLKKEAGLPKPWTTDKILQQYRFCNIHREDDTVTKWIKNNWRDPHRENPDLWFAMVIARLINLPGCLQDIGWPVPWNPEKFLRVMAQRKAAGKNTFNSAYIVSTNGKAMDKAEYLEQYVLTPMWEKRTELRPRAGDTLALFAKRLESCIGMGTFMTGQVVADLKYAVGIGGLPVTDDWSTWATPGPGSKRGLNYICGKDMDTPWGKDWLPTLTKLRDEVNAELNVRQPTWEAFHAQDLQNCLCELSKWAKVKRGLGRPKSTYPGV